MKTRRSTPRPGFRDRAGRSQVARLRPWRHRRRQTSRSREGNRERVQAYEGVVIGKKNAGLNSAFTVRKISHGFGVERVFQTHSATIDLVQVKRRGDVRAGKLYYLRGRGQEGAHQEDPAGNAISHSRRGYRRRRVPFRCAACNGHLRVAVRVWGSGMTKQDDIAASVRLDRNGSGPRVSSGRARWPSRPSTPARSRSRATRETVARRARRRCTLLVACGEERFESRCSRSPTCAARPASRKPLYRESNLRLARTRARCAPPNAAATARRKPDLTSARRLIRALGDIDAG